MKRYLITFSYKTEWSDHYKVSSAHVQIDRSLKTNPNKVFKEVVESLIGEEIVSFALISFIEVSRELEMARSYFVSFIYKGHGVVAHGDAIINIKEVNDSPFTQKVDGMILFLCSQTSAICGTAVVELGIITLTPLESE